MSDYDHYMDSMMDDYMSKMDACILWDALAEAKDVIESDMKMGMIALRIKRISQLGNRHSDQSIRDYEYEEIGRDFVNIIKNYILSVCEHKWESDDGHKWRERNEENED